MFNVVEDELILGSKSVNNDNSVEDHHDAIFIAEASLKDEDDDDYTFNEEEGIELPYNA
jgi:hypothetical protein